MGRKTHGPYLIAAIEANDVQKVSDILSTKFRDKSKVKTFLASEVRRLASDSTEVPLLLAAGLDDPTIIRYVVEKHDANVNHVHEHGSLKQRKRTSPLLVAVKRGLYATVDAIIGLNANVNFQDHKGRSPLHHAIRRADYRMAKLLLSRGSQVSVVDVANNSPLHVATIYGHSELIKLLLRYGGDLYKKGQHGAVPIHMAAREGHNNLVRMFCEIYEVSPDIKVPCYDGLEKSPLHVAASQGHAETALVLLDECGADANVLDSEGNTPLHHSVLQEYDPLGMKAKDDFTDTVKVLLNKGCEVNVQNGRGETAMHLAARNEFQKVIEVLVLAGCDPVIEDNNKSRSLDLVAEDDTVSKQIIKKAMEDRNKLLHEAPRVRERGFLTNFQRGTFATASSQSLLNMSNMNHHKFNKSYPNNVGQASRGNMSAAISSSNSSKRHSRESVYSGTKISPLPETLSVASRRVRSVENLDSRQKQKKMREREKLRGEHRREYLRKNSYQDSEMTSMWSVTPPGSMQDIHSEANYRSGRNQKHTKPYRAPDSMNKNFERTIEKSRFSSEDEEYYLDDEESMDGMLDEGYSKRRQYPDRNGRVNEWMSSQQHLGKSNKNRVPEQRTSGKSQSSYVSSDSESSSSDGKHRIRNTRSKPVPPPKPGKKHVQSSAGIEKIIELEVDDHDASGQTTIRVIPVNSPRSTRANQPPHVSAQPSGAGLDANRHKNATASKKQLKNLQTEADEQVEQMQRPQPRERNIKNIKPKTENKPSILEPNLLPAQDSRVQNKTEKLNKDVTVQKKGGDLVFEKASMQSLDNLQHSNLARISAGEKAAPAKPTYSSTISPILLNNSFDNSSKILQQIQSKHSTSNISSSMLSFSNSMQKEDNSNISWNAAEESYDDSTLASLRPKIGQENIHRMITFSNADGLPFTLVGGNKTGIFIDDINQSSTAFKNGLLRGDRILKINDSLAFGKTREEINHILRQCEGRATLEVCNDPEEYASVTDGRVDGECFYVKAHFSCEGQKKGDLDVKAGNVFVITDTVPPGNSGFWKAKALGSKHEEVASGLIPNEQRARQIVARKKLLDVPLQEKGGLMHGFKRKKKESHLSSSDLTEIDSNLDNSLVYERVKLKKTNFFRPVIILGLFCDVVINKLLKEYPELFEKSQETLEVASNDEMTVNVEALSKYGQDRHLLTIFSPPSIEYLQVNTEFHPIVIYLAPVSKVVVKSIKNKLAPNYAKDANFMFEEAVKFQENYKPLFTTVINYTVDEQWFHYIKTFVANAQNQSVWQSMTTAEQERTIAKEYSKYFPDDARKAKSTQKNIAPRRLSRTTDDIQAARGEQIRPESNKTLNSKKQSGSTSRLYSQTKKSGKVAAHTHETPL